MIKGDYFALVYEKLALQELSKGGRLRARKCDEEKVVDVKLPKPDKVESKLRQLENVGQVEQGVFALPLHSNFPAVDAVYEGALFQVTLSSRHPVKANPLADMVNCLRRNGWKADRLYFVVPSQVFERFGTQSYSKPRES